MAETESQNTMQGDDVVTQVGYFRISNRGPTRDTTKVTRFQNTRRVPHFGCESELKFVSNDKTYSKTLNDPHGA